MEKKSVLLYCVPPEIVPDDTTVVRVPVSVPAGLLPRVITRADSDVSAVVQQVFAWFVDNLSEVDGYIPASAAIPMLWLDGAVYEQAVQLLREAVAGYSVVQGPVFVGTGIGRDAKFNVADWYHVMFNGSTLTPVVTFKQSIDNHVSEEELELVDGETAS